MVICLERGADLHMAQLMPLPLTVSCSSKIQIGFVQIGQRAVKRVCVCVCVVDLDTKAINSCHILQLDNCSVVLYSVLETN